MTQRQRQRDICVTALSQPLCVSGPGARLTAVPVPDQPTRSDGVVTLRPCQDDDIEPTRLAHDEAIADAFGFPEVIPSARQHRQAVQRWSAAYAAERRTVNFVVEYAGQPVGTVEVRDQGDRLGQLSWTLYPPYRGQGLATRAVCLLLRYAFDELGMERLEAYVAPDNISSLRVAARCGLRREGLLRRRENTGAVRRDHVLLARLHDDPEPHDPAGSRALLNAALPRKRVIAQLAIRDRRDRLLLCELTYKRDWDFPGGVVEVGESPRVAAAAETAEELGLRLPVGRLVAVDWLPTWSGWDDACVLVYDGGVVDESIVGQITPEPHEIRSAGFCSRAEAVARCADFTARRVQALLDAVPSTTLYLESGRPVDG